MRASTLKYTTVTVASYAALFLIAVVPFHAFLTIWGSSIVGHYTALRLWKEVLLVFCAVVALYLLIFDAKIRAQAITRRLLHVIAAYAIVTVVWAGFALANDMVTLKAAAYGILINLRYLAFFVICWSLAARSSKLQKYWFKAVIIPAALVIGFGLLQIFVLPHDFLRHFGYSDLTIPAYETINNNKDFIRVQSFLRGANPLGTYLLVPLSFVMYRLCKNLKDWRFWVLLIGGVIVLAFTYSRAAWIGFVVTALCTVVLQFGSKITRIMWAAMGLACVLFVVIGFTVVHQNARLENILLHTESNSQVTTSSNEGHIAAVRISALEVLHEPLGRGPGSAGPASVYSNHPARIAENYYLQIGQEIGWIGLALFITVQLGVVYILWLRRSTMLAACLLAAFAGLTVVSMFSHAWTDDTLAYVWWGLAGIAMAPLIISRRTK